MLTAIKVMYMERLTEEIDGYVYAMRRAIDSNPPDFVKFQEYVDGLAHLIREYGKD